MPREIRGPFGPVDTVERAIRLQIERGNLMPGDRLLSERELSRKYLVSRGTLRKALARITAEGILQRKGRGGTLVAKAPERVAGEKVVTSTVIFAVALALPDTLAQHPWLNEMYNGAEDGALAAGWNIVVQFGNALRRHLALLREGSVARPAGIILLGYGGAALAEECELCGVPSVLTDYSAMSGLFDSVEPDNYGSGQLAADYLLQLGHRRVGAVALRFEGQRTPPVGIRDRLRGWSDALANRDIAVDPSWQRMVDVGQDGQISDKGARDLHDFLRAPSRPTAIFVPAHVPAINLYQACLEAGLRVPQDMSLVVFDHVPAMSSPRVKFTTCLVDRELMGRVAWECLQSRIERKSHVVMKHVLPAHMVEGQTTQRPALNAGA